MRRDIKDRVGVGENELKALTLVAAREEWKIRSVSC